MYLIRHVDEPAHRRLLSTRDGHAPDRLAAPLAARPAAHPLDPRGAPGSDHAPGDEGDDDEGAPGAGEDQAGGLILVSLHPTLVVPTSR